MKRPVVSSAGVTAVVVLLTVVLVSLGWPSVHASANGRRYVTTWTAPSCVAAAGVRIGYRTGRPVATPVLETLRAFATPHAVRAHDAKAADLIRPVERFPAHWAAVHLLI